MKYYPGMDSFLLNDERIELRLLFDIVRTFDKYVELRTALGPLLNLLETRAGLTWSMVTLLDRGTGLLKIEEAYGLTAEEKERGRYRLGEGLVGRVFETGMPITVEDLSRDNRFLNRAKNRTQKDMQGLTYYCVPIRSGGGVIGTLSAERRIEDETRNAQMSWDKAFLEKVSAIIADSAKLRERITEEQFRFRKNEADGRLLRSGGDARAAGGRIAGGTIVGGRIAEGSAIIGTDNAMRGVYEMLLQVAPSDATVLITGESGTGKEIVAVELHRLSKRRAAAFVKINCAALPESIIESELFGHEKGAFTGAVSLHKGKFEQAHRGTIFLDEIGEISPQIQVKLLRVLQEREIERVGGAATIKVDVRLVAATNRNLEDAVKAGRFREDLYYRLNVFPLHIPPLRERKSDIMLLADHFAEKYAEKNNKLIKRISSSAIDLLASYSWPGNVRELENCIERAVILSTDAVIHSYNLPPSLQSPSSSMTEPNTTLDAALSRLEKELIIEALKISEGNMSAASRRLGITERQMGLRVHHYGINCKLYKAAKI
jgi:Nif-specific regulatory protein